MKIFFTLFFAILYSYGNENALLDLEKERLSLVNSYSVKIANAKKENLFTRAELLNTTLDCFKDSKSRRDISNCKVDERKRIMSMIKG